MSGHACNKREMFAKQCLFADDGDGIGSSTDIKRW